MLSRFILFYLVMQLTGSPLLGILAIVALYLLIDYQFTGFFRRGIRAVRMNSEIARLKREVALNPHNAASLSDIGRLLVMRKKEGAALPYLERAYERLSDSEETTYYLGLAYLGIGRQQQGEALVLKSLEMNPRFRYGEPALRLAEYYAAQGRAEEAKVRFDQFFSIHSSSSEGYYKFGRFQLQVGNIGRAVESFRKAIEVFKLSPSFKRREDRLWAYKARYHLGRVRLAYPGTHTP
jgi:tetratricopeptide (TPR) repeat protein